MAPGRVVRRRGGFATPCSRALLLGLAALSIVSLCLETLGGGAVEDIGSRSVPGVEEDVKQTTPPAGVAADGDGSESKGVGESGGGNGDEAADKEKEEPFTPPMPSDAVVSNVIEDLELKNLEEERKKLPADMRDALSPELWGAQDVKAYKSAVKTIEKGQKVLDTAAKMATFGGLMFGTTGHATGEAGAVLMVVGFLGMLITGILAVPPAIGGAIQRGLGRRRLKKLKALLKRKQALVKKRTEMMSFDAIDGKTPLDDGKDSSSP